MDSQVAQMRCNSGLPEVGCCEQMSEVKVDPVVFWERLLKLHKSWNVRRRRSLATGPGCAKLSCAALRAYLWACLLSGACPVSWASLMSWACLVSGPAWCPGLPGVLGIVHREQTEAS